MKIKKEKLIWITLCLMLAVLATPQKINAASVQNNVENKTLTVTFNTKGGTAAATSKIVTLGSTYGELPAVTREYYIFKGWFTYSYGGVKVTKDSTVKIPEPHTLYAHWTGKEQEITLDASGGKMNTAKVTVYYGTKYKNQLPNPTKENYVFDGWYTTAKGGDKITSGSVYDATSKKKLYAHWIEKKLKIDFIAYNGEPYQKEVICGKKYGKMPVPKREGYTFNGWYTWEDYSDYDAEPVTENSVVTESDPLKLFARWYR